MKEMILCKYGEIALKGANRAYFETLLRKTLQRRVNKFGKFKIYAMQSTLYIEPEDDGCDVSSAYEAAKNTFGVAAVSRAYGVEKTMDAIIAATERVMPALSAFKTFKVEAKRSDKSFPLTSPEICAEIGGVILDCSHGRLKVDVGEPETTVRVEIRDKNAFISASQERAVGGMPVGSSGTALLLLSGCGASQSSGTAEEEKKETPAVEETYDVDLTKLGSTMVYAEVYNMVSNPSEYIGKKVKMNGAFAIYEGDLRIYFACIIKDATACCSQGLEFVLKDERKYPDEYPELGSDIVVGGIFDVYYEDGVQYFQLSDAEIL